MLRVNMLPLLNKYLLSWEFCFLIFMASLIFNSWSVKHFLIIWKYSTFPARCTRSNGFGFHPRGFSSLNRDVISKRPFWSFQCRQDLQTLQACEFKYNIWSVFLGIRDALFLFDRCCCCCIMLTNHRQPTLWHHEFIKY